MSVPRAFLACLAAAATAVLVAAPANAAPAPGLTVSSVAVPTNFDPAESIKASYDVWIQNAGAVPTDGSPITITDTLPAGLTITQTRFRLRYRHEVKDFGEGKKGVCSNDEPTDPVTVTCTIPEELPGSGQDSAVIYPGESMLLTIFVTGPALSEGASLTNNVAVEGGGTPVAAVSSQNAVSATPAPPGFSHFSAQAFGPDGLPESRAGAHPYQFTTSFSLNSRANPPEAQEPAEVIPSGGDPKDMPVMLPPGLIGNPTAVPQCPMQKFVTTNLYNPFPETPQIQFAAAECPDETAVGFIAIRRALSADPGLLLPIFNLTPPPGMAAQFGFTLFNLPFFIDTEVRPSENYKVVAAVRSLSEAKRIVSASVTFWGDPSDPSHDPIRGNCLNGEYTYPIGIPYSVPGVECPFEAESTPFMRMPTNCLEELDIQMGLSTWSDPDTFATAHSLFPPSVGCNQLGFEPALKARPTTNIADSPSGLEVDLHLPQAESGGLGEADLRKAVVILPKGIALNPASANGLAACSEEQIGYRGKEGALDVYSDEVAHCPPASRIGEVQVDTPLLEKPLNGSVYVAAPYANPFDSLLAIYIAVADPERGVVVKLAGRVEPDPVSGQLVTTFDENPQVPFDHFLLDFFGGANAALRTPPTCGTFTTTSSLTPWSAPESGPPATPSDSYAITASPTGGACPGSDAERPNSPTFSAGTLAPIAAAHSPMVINLRREDGSQEFSSLTVTPPPGLIGSLAGIPYCPEAALAAAANRSGRDEQANPSCPAASKLGTVSAGAGAGPAPYYTEGTAYLTGPYKGAPISLAILTPAVAGPYDLGTVVVRTALNVDPVSARITAVSDPIPHILRGVPLDIRSIQVRLDRPSFVLNPSSCASKSFEGALQSVQGQSRSLSARFQVGECGALPFKPKLAISLKGGTKRNSHPALKATLSFPPGATANTAAASVALPHSLFLAQDHIRTICTRVQFAADACPAGSIYGRAKAITPLLDAPLEGPVYLRASSNPLPDLVADLKGQIDVVLVGRIDSVNNGIRTTFDATPDAPVSSFTLEMQGARKGLLVNSRDLCAHPNRATALFDAHNGKIADFRPKIGVRCKGAKGKGKGRKGGKR